jgi:hypothetical protein
MNLKFCFSIFFIFSIGNAHSDAKQTPENVCEKAIALVGTGINDTPSVTQFAQKYFTTEMTVDVKKLRKFISFYDELSKADSSSRQEICDSFIDKNKSMLKTDIPKVPQNVNHGQTSELAENSNTNVRSLTRAKAQAKEEQKQLCTQDQIKQCDGGEPIYGPDTETIENVLNYIPKGGVVFYTERDCECLEENLSKQRKSAEEVLKESKDELAEIDKLIIKATGKKFINDYASFHEDISYYENTKAISILEKNKTTVDDSYLCKDFKSMKKTIDVACKKSGMSVGQDLRTAEILGVYGMPFGKGDSGFVEGFQHLLNDMDAPYSLTDDKNNKSQYSRRTYDDARYGLSKLDKGQPEVIAVNDIVTSIVKSKSLNQRLKDLLAVHPDYTPLEAIELLLADKDNQSEIKTLLKRSENSKHNGLMSSLVSLQGSAGFDKERSRVFNVAIAMHPGLKQVLLDRTLYANASAKVNDVKGIVDAVEKDHLLSNHFSQRCKSLENNLADAICSHAKDLRDKIAKEDLIQILDAKDPEATEKSNALKLLVCSTLDNKVAKGSAFENLNLNGTRSFNTSDYRDRKEFPEPSSFFANMGKKTIRDAAFAKSMNQMSESYADERISNSVLIKSKAYRESDDYKPFSSEEFIANIKNGPKSTISSSEIASMPKDDRTHAPLPQAVKEATFTPMVPEFRASAPIKETILPGPQEFKQVNPGDAVNSKNELKNYFANSAPEKVKRHIENINDEDAKELLTLKDQLNKNREEFNAFKLAQETSKLNELKLQNEALQKKLEEITNGKQAEPSRSFASTSDVQGYKSTGVPKDFINDFDKRIMPEDIGSSGSSDQSSPVGASKASIKSDSGLSAAAALGTSHDGESSLNRIIISSSSTDGNRGHGDPSTELINYISKQAPDNKSLSELQELKESGMIYSYNVKDNGKEVRVTKLIKYEELSKEAKILVDNKILLLSQSDELKKSNRRYSFQALMLEILNHRNY